MIERTPEFDRAVRSAFPLFLIPFFILGAVMPGLFSYFGYEEAETTLMFVGVAISVLVANPLILKARIKEFPRHYWRYYYAGYGSLFGVVLFIGVAMYWTSIR